MKNHVPTLFIVSHFYLNGFCCTSHTGLSLHLEHQGPQLWIDAFSGKLNPPDPLLPPFLSSLQWGREQGHQGWLHLYSPREGGLRLPCSAVCACRGETKKSTGRVCSLLPLPVL